MKRLLELWAILLTASGLLMGAAVGSPAVTYVGHEKVEAALAKGGMLVTAKDLLVLGAHRTEAGHVEMHEKETDVFYIIDGEATFITGGKMIGGKLAKPGQWLGMDIQGGTVHYLSKGDVIVIPAGIPHWYKEVPHSVTYYVVKVLKP
ncbi:MAG TPA: cupin domain-containing protein [Terriglobia bacterium]|nr:cupin domain-containing protein [Terriglobia bacterium]